MAKVFISYRRTDSAAISGRIYDRLVAKFKRKNVFKDVDNIPAGVNFGAYIQQSVRECAVMLVVIGRQWLDARVPDGRRRLDDPVDWVRVEIESALNLGLTVIPLLVEDTSIPMASDLPKSLRELARLNALLVRNDPDFAHDMERVINAIERAPATQRPASLSSIFRWGPTTQSAPHQKLSAKAAQSKHRTSHEPLFTMPSHPSVPSAFATPHMAPPKQPSATGRALGRNILPAIVAAVLIIVSLGVLLSKGIAPFNTNTTNVATQTGYAWASATARAKGTATSDASAMLTAFAATTQTFTARFPLSITALGPGCDHSWASSYWSLDVGNITCANDRTHLNTTSTCSGSNCLNSGEFRFYSTSSPNSLPLPLPGSYTISVRESGFTGVGDVKLIISGILRSSGEKVVYTFDIYNGGYMAGRDICPSAIDIDNCWSHGPPYEYNSNLINTSQSHSLAFRFDGRTVTAELDGRSVGTHAESESPTLDQVLFEVNSISNATTSHIDFSNFSIAAS